MSDFDNLREDEYERKLEESNEKRDAEIDFHAENWINAVTQSPAQSHGTFDDVKDYSTKGWPLRPATSLDIFIEELHNADFLEQAAAILLKLRGNVDIDNLLDEMAASYADNEYESNIKE